MNLILLGGNSIRNKSWIEDVRDGLKPLFDETKILYYKHWEEPINEEAVIDLDLETTRLEELTNNFGEYAIFAKSFGTILTMKAVYEGKINPKLCIFTGTAIKLAREQWGDKTDLWLKNFKIPTLFIQKEKDPAFSGEELEDLITEYELTDAHFIEIPGDNHQYEDIKLLKDLIEEFLK